MANAGLIQNVTVGALVTLSGSGSRDADNDPLTYKWQLTSKPDKSVAALTSETTAAPQFTADLAGTYTITLIVNDSNVSSPSSTVTIVASVTNSAPMANAGPNQNIQIGTTVTLDGTASTDANSDTLSYKWNMIGRPATSLASLSSTSSPNPKFTADVMGIYTITLLVNDGKLDSTPVPVTVIASNTNSAPVSNAGTAQSVVAGAVVTLDGTSSSDANSDPLTFKWYWATKPPGSNAAMSLDTSAKPTFTADRAGAYVFTLIVNDGKVSSEIAAVTITASVANAAPVANAGAAQSVTTASVVTLNGTGSTDANNDTLTYRWTLAFRPTNSTATLSSATAPSPTFTADLSGIYLANLIVNDGKVDSSNVGTVAVSAAAANSAPMANAGTAQTVTRVGGTITFTLNGTGSSDANGDTLTYKWTIAYQPSTSTATLSSSTGASPTITATVAGIYVFNLVVNDGKVDSSAVSSVSVNVN